jgi:hypothetical protein
MAAKVKVEPGGSMIVPRASAIGAKQKPISKSAASGFAPKQTPRRSDLRPIGSPRWLHNRLFECAFARYFAKSFADEALELIR